jgi:hypothetical protein
LDCRVGELAAEVSLGPSNLFDCRDVFEENVKRSLVFLAVVVALLHCR